MEDRGAYGNASTSGCCDPLRYRPNVKHNEPLLVKIMKPDFDITTMNCELMLRLSVTNGRNNITHMLIKKGVDIDCIHPVTGYTSLHLAVIYQQYEAACMLLHYGASAEIKSFEKETPFMLALKHWSDHKYAELLFDYVFDFKARNSKGESILYLAVTHQSPLIQKILAHCGIKSIVACLKLSTCRTSWMTKERSYIFKYLFPLVDHAKLAQKYVELLDDLMKAFILDSEDFMECFYLVLNSDYAQKFVQRCTTLVPLIKKFIRYKTNLSDRLSCLYSLLSLGVNITFEGFDEIYRYFGFNEELEAILETRPNIGIQQYYQTTRSVTNNIAYVIFYSYRRSNGPVTLIRCIDQCIDQQNMLNNYSKFFTDTDYYDRQRMYYPPKSAEEVNENEVPNLRELTRNVVRDVILSSKLTKGSMYKVYDAIKTLPVPKIIRDILHLKHPLYM